MREQFARAEAVEARRRLALLAAAGPVLSGSLDYEKRLEEYTPPRAELATVLLDIMEDNGSITSSPPRTRKRRRTS